MRILKFGGSSVATPERILQVARIVRDASRSGSVAVVVSAFGGVTDELLQVARAAESRDEAYDARRRALADRHHAAARELAASAEAGALAAAIDDVFLELGELLHGAFLVREASPRTLDRILGTGERLSASIVAAAFRARGIPAQACDARRLIVTGPQFGSARVIEDATRRRIRDHFTAAPGLQVVTGFIAATEADEATTLGRGGSDYTASIVGAALDAEAVELWTDVDGVLSADPRVVPNARPAPRMTYEELMELSHFGAKVVYPPSVHPTRERGIPLWIKNTFRPEAPGTLVIADASGDPSGPLVRGIASIPEISLLRLEGDGMVGVPGIAMRLFGSLARRGVNVIMISQASSEHSICFAVAPASTESAAEGVAEEFRAERRAGLIDDLVIERGLSVVAVVGAGMRDRAGVAGRLFQVLGRHGVNVRAIAQGSSELNISLVVSRDDERSAVCAIHDAFFEPDTRRVDVVQAGVGGVGGELLRQWSERAREHARAHGLDLRWVALGRSGGGLLDANGLDADGALDALEALAAPAPSNGAEWWTFALARGASPRVFVDCTASGEVAARYDEIARSGLALVSANKLRFAGSQADFDSLRSSGAGRVFFETTVGAALPVLRTIDDLVATGDRVRRIEGLLSGTLGFLLGELAAGTSFSAAVGNAHRLGYTEPDPREDLGGRDVARKLVILARVAGYRLEPHEVTVESLLPSDWNGISTDEFWRRLPSLDAAFAERSREARAAGRRLVYLASFDGSTGRAGLVAVEPDHPAAGVSGTANLFALTTDRYDSSPLVVRGPGAGPALTASGVLADLLRAAERVSR